MEHEEIALDQKQDPRNKGTRYGIKGRGTIKFNIGQHDKERKFTGEIQMVKPQYSIKVSLKKKKNWEISQQAFDDNNEGFKWRELKKQFSPKEPEVEEPAQIINGTNRKGFFVREKRRPGKKGVKRNTNTVSDGESSSEEDTIDSDENEKKEQNKDEGVLCILTVPRGRQADIWNSGGDCNCRSCRGYGAKKNLTDRTRRLVKKEAIELL